MIIQHHQKKIIMKAIFKFRNLMGALTISALAFVFTSCDKDDPAPVPNIVQQAQSNPDLTILVAAVAKAGLVDALSNSTANLTVFAPVNSAFEALGYSVASINALNASVPADAATIATLKSVLEYHVVGERIPSSAVTTSNIEKATLNAGNKIYATGNASGPFTGVYINGVKVVTPDVAASNGVIHTIGKVLLPPAGTLLQVATSTAIGGNTTPAGFSLLVAAVLRADQATSTQAAGVVTGALAGAGPLTVFAPNNAAFSAIGLGTEAAINAYNANDLRRIILYHVIPARVFSSNLTATEVATALDPLKKVTIGLPASGATVLGVGNGGNASKIVATDIMATNGVIHAIDRVLLP
jgi:uncharacterized surface protein with fasciclin (FAS1) repeats